MSHFKAPWTIVGVSAMIILLPWCLDAHAETEDAKKENSLLEALKNGEAKVALRYRYESVSQEGFDKDAGASTLRTTISYRTKKHKRLSFFVEAENVAAVGGDGSYNNVGASHLNNGVRDRPVVADPEVTEINQATVSAQFGGTDFHLGRREIVIANARYVGNVGWRQNHQSFDSASISSTHGRGTFAYHYVTEVNRIFGDSVGTNNHFLTGDFELPRSAKLSIYGFFLDYDELIGLSTSTVGVRVEGKPAVGRGRLGYAFEYAEQQDHADNPNEVEASYYLVELGGGSKTFSATVGFEVLEGSPGRGRFTTPLATLHKFNGWADKFLATPAAGLEDLYLTLGGSVRKAGWKVVYHDFQSNFGELDYGTEIDGLLTLKTDWGQVLGLKLALYDADRHSVDTDKVMVWTSFAFGR